MLQRLVRGVLWSVMVARHSTTRGKANFQPAGVAETYAYLSANSDSYEYCTVARRM